MKFNKWELRLILRALHVLADSIYTSEIMDADDKRTLKRIDALRIKIG